MPEEQKSFLFRLPMKLFLEVSAWANEERRSVTGQIIRLLEKAVDERKRLRDRQRGERDT